MPRKKTKLSKTIQLHFDINSPNFECNNYQNILVEKQPSGQSVDSFHSHKQAILHWSRGHHARGLRLCLPWCQRGCDRAH
jgi:hypothetical protein